MIEQALYEHLQAQEALKPYLATYGDKMAIFNQEAPADTDAGWAPGPQYGRIVFFVNLHGDPARTMGGTLTVDILCKEDEQYPEEIEPILRDIIHGYLFSNHTFVVSAQWKQSAPFTEPTNKVTGCTVTFDLLAFPVSNYAPNVIAQFNEWCSGIENIYVINHDQLPAAAWKPCNGETAVYWRAAKEEPCRWIPTTHSTVWMSATVKGYIFSETPAKAAEVANDLKIRLYAVKRLQKDGVLLRAGESPIMVNRSNIVDNGADPLRVGQLTVEATYGIIVYFESDEVIRNINY
ncbi:MAG: hypothetical protein ACI4PO_09090 [Faecousia sp.]